MSKDFLQPSSLDLQIELLEKNSELLIAESTRDILISNLETIDEVVKDPANCKAFNVKYLGLGVLLAAPLSAEVEQSTKKAQEMILNIHQRVCPDFASHSKTLKVK